jgi:catechol 2,3-dioxygenase-like lactoylglutathione lyase family enzyme
MFDHVVFSVSNYEEAKTFFVKALAPLGVGIVSEGELGAELCRKDSQSSLCIRRVEERATHLHLAFATSSRQQVREFYAAAIAAGGKDNGPPGLRPQYNANYYAAFVIGPDGHNIEAVCHLPEA